MRYIGQICRPFKIRFRKHLHDFKYGNGKSRFAQHLIENGHSIGRMKDTMVNIHITSKWKIVDTLEKCYVFRETKLNNQINDKLTIKQNIILDTIVRYDHHRSSWRLYLEQTTHCFSHTRSPLPFTVIQVSTEQHTSGRSSPPPRSTKFNTTLRNKIYSPKNSRQRTQSNDTKIRKTRKHIVHISK